MEASWLAELVVKLIEWKYGVVVKLEDLQNVEYDPGGTLCKCCRTLTTYSNTVVLLAMSFVIVTASGQYVNNGVNPYTANSSELHPTTGTSVFPDRDLSLDVSLERVTILPMTKFSLLTMYSSVGISRTSPPPPPPSSTIVVPANLDAPSSLSSSSSSDRRRVHISKSDNKSSNVRLKNTTSDNDTTTTIVDLIFSLNNDSQVPKFSNRTPHFIESESDGSQYFGVLSVLLGLMILLTIVGNVFVIAAILIEKNLQNVANYLIVSLAVADLMVACLVMPLGAVYEISEGWVLGPELCDMWTASDVLCCTASILHLVAIALDRYWAVTDVEYVTKRSAWRIVVMIIIIWTVALVVSVAPQFGWKDPEYLDRINLEKRCLVSQDIGYQIFATCATFYVPLLAILVLYWKIFQAARRRIHKRGLRNQTFGGANATKNSTSHKKRFNFFNKKSHSSNAAATTTTAKIECDLETGVSTNIAMMDIPSSCSAADSSQENAPATTNNKTPAEFAAADGKIESASLDRSLNATANNSTNEAGMTVSSKLLIDSSMSTLITKQIQKVKSKRDKKQTLEAKREKKAAKTLAIITGAFVICWLPFFVMALVMPICSACYINRYVSSFFLWLGYFNSTLNPIIYTVFSPEFRQAFNKILCGMHKSGLRTR